MEPAWTKTSVICARYCRSSILNCTNISIEQEISHTSTSATDGFCWTLSEVRHLWTWTGSFSTLASLEFVYEDIFLVWETIAAARRTVSKRFVLFIALAMMKSYREIILDNRMDFTDIIRFFNGSYLSNNCSFSFEILCLVEMAERHDAREILRISRELILELQKLIDNKWTHVDARWIFYLVGMIKKTFFFLRFFFCCHNVVMVVFSFILLRGYLHTHISLSIQYLYFWTSFSSIFIVSYLDK